MLGAELAYDPKIKVFAFIKYYNFALVHISMQSFYDIVQPRSNIPLENDVLHYNYNLETKLALGSVWLGFWLWLLAPKAKSPTKGTVF